MFLPKLNYASSSKKYTRNEEYRRNSRAEESRLLEGKLPGKLKVY